ncbi:MAG: peptidyl-prolyl cis-trans isomerase [Candidatus Aminicenantes bacterium]|jgi:foldase protein PrsA|nr:peptidyl-prolyl cis-trans isomerase [Candidatus Aminicenantes bacterium]
MRKIVGIAVLVLVSAFLSGQVPEPEHVTVQHILIAFQGTIPDAGITRSLTDAQKLAQELLMRARQGEDFDALVRQYTNDAYPGIYSMANAGTAPDAANQEFSRTRMVKAFGDVGFGLKVGEIGMAVYDHVTSKYGWHIIKRLR